MNTICTLSGTHTKTEWKPNGRIDVRCGNRNKKTTTEEKQEGTTTNTRALTANAVRKIAKSNTRRILSISPTKRMWVNNELLYIYICFYFSAKVFSQRKAHTTLCTYFSSRGWQWCAAFQDGESETLLRFGRLTNDDFFCIICAEADGILINFNVVLVRLFGGGMRKELWWNVTEHSTAESSVQRRTQ